MTNRVLIMGNNDHNGGLIIHYRILADWLNTEPLKLFCININDHNQTLFRSGSTTEMTLAYQPASILEKAKKWSDVRSVARSARNFDPEVFIAVGIGNAFVRIAEKLPKAFKVYQEVIFDATKTPLRENMLRTFNAVAVQTPGMISEYKKNVSTALPVGYLPCFSKEYPVRTTGAPLNGSNGPLRIAYFGRLAWNKGIVEFIRSTFETFQTQDVLLDIFGKGEEREPIELEVSKHNLTEKITLKGAFADEDFQSIIETYHAVIIPSLCAEGLPLVLIESMRFGKPVLATSVGAMPEVATLNPGVIITDTSSHAINTAFRSLLARLASNDFDSAVITGAYQNNFSNAIFKGVWKRMLDNPLNYFYA